MTEKQLVEYWYCYLGSTSGDTGETEEYPAELFTSAAEAAAYFAEDLRLADERLAGARVYARPVYRDGGHGPEAMAVV